MLCVLIYKSLHHLIYIMRSTLQDLLAKDRIQQSTNIRAAVGTQPVSLCQL